MKYWFLIISITAISCTSQNKTSMEHAFTNELIHETSPYLLQHSHNPVNWMPWGEKAMNYAKKDIN